MKPSDLTDKMRAMLPRDAKKVLGVYGLTLEEVLSKREVKTERDIHNQIEQWLRSKGIQFQHERMDRKTRGTVGWPDFTFAWHGTFAGVPIAYPVGVEVKGSGGALSPEQELLHIKLRDDGWKVFVVYSFAQLVEELKALR